MTTTARPPTTGRRETRYCATRLEARADGLQGVVEGYASVFETPYPMGSHDEVVSRGAFRATLAKKPDCMLLIQHEGLPLARTVLPPGQPGHLSLSEDSHGLHFSAQLDKSDPDAQTLLRKLSSGLLSEASFAFRVVRDDYEPAKGDSRPLRRLREVDLHKGDISVVSYGANPAASSSARSRQPGHYSVNRTVELFLRFRAGGVTSSALQQDVIARTVVDRLQRGLPIGPLASSLRLSKAEVRWLTQLARQP